MIFDTHCHLNDDVLYNDIERVILDAQNAGVSKFLVVGYNKKSSLLAVKIAQKYDFCYASIGFHPTEIFDLSDIDFNEIYSLASDKKVVAVGEIGLDYYWIKEEDKRQLQKEYFIKQIELANKLNLPISVHCRDAIEDCYSILEKHNPVKGGIMHCFSSSKEMMEKFLKLGFYISFGGPVTFLNAKDPKICAQNCPMDKILVETDSPYLSPHPLRGTINESKNIRYIVEAIALLKGVDVSEIENITYKNACRIFGIK